MNNDEDVFKFQKCNVQSEQQKQPEENDAHSGESPPFLDLLLYSTAARLLLGLKFILKEMH